MSTKAERCRWGHGGITVESLRMQRATFDSLANAISSGLVPYRTSRVNRNIHPYSPQTSVTGSLSPSSNQRPPQTGVGDMYLGLEEAVSSVPL